MEQQGVNCKKCGSFQQFGQIVCRYFRCTSCGALIDRIDNRKMLRLEDGTVVPLE